MSNSVPGATIHEAASPHQAGVQRLVRSYAAVPPGATVRLAKKSSNLFRARDATAAPGLDVSGLAGVLRVDAHARTADVAGMCTYEDLVAATLPLGLSPLVVPQLKTITLGGAVTGLGIESASFRNGLPHESVLELDVLTGTGDIVTATPDNEHAALFSSFPNSYGTLGYATRLRIELEPVAPYVALRHVRFHDLDELTATVAAVTAARTFDGARVDYLDGVVFSAAESYLTMGMLTEETGPTSDYTGQQIYYRSIRQRSTDRLSIDDYLWRWDTDWFWCSGAFGAQHPVIRRVWPKRLRRSSVYSKIIAMDARYRVADRIEERRGRPARERVVQDVEVPVERTAEFLRWFLATVPIDPIWLCPVRLRGERTWDLYPMTPDRTYVNVGFWSSVAQQPGQPGATNRLIEQQVSAMDGHKSLYSDSYYPPEEFAARYGGARYDAVKHQYDPTSRLLDLYAKAVRKK